MQPQLAHGIVAKSPLLMLLTLVKAARENSKQVLRDLGHSILAI